MNTLLIEPHFLPTIPFFTLAQSYDRVQWDVHSFYQKQTFCNRSPIMAANGVLNLVVPVKKGSSKILMKDIKIDNSYSWNKAMVRSIQSAYGKSPFFEYYAPEIVGILEKKFEFLLDLNSEILTKCLALLKLNIILTFTESYVAKDQDPSKFQELNGDRNHCRGGEKHDFRSIIHPKKKWGAKAFYQPINYVQVFGSNFVPSLGIVDLLFCTGPESNYLLKQSLIKGSKNN